MWKHELSVTVKHFQLGVSVGDDLTQECVNFYISTHLFAKCCPFFLVADGSKPIHRGLEMKLHMSMIGGILFLQRPVENPRKGLYFAPVVNLGLIEFMPQSF